ncbi:MAG TPA: trimethylamine methyltransferase family protein [Thermohalobaculum sp.]|nr:trimethylamine methyltransferase family protein [Thermohalobaculum sp.]
MASDQRRGRGTRRRTRDAGDGQIAQLPWRRVTNPWPPMEILDAEGLEAIHDASMRILGEMGIELMHAGACERLARAGADWDRETMTVRLDRAMVAEWVAKAPARVTLTPRNPERRVHLGGRDLVTTLVAGPPAVHDRVRGRRTANMEDYSNFIRLTQHFNAVHMIGNQVAAPVEMPANTRHLDCYLANLTLSDRSYHCTSIGRGRALDGIAMMALARGISLDDMVGDPGVTTIISVNSPRRFDEAMAEGLMTLAECGQPISVTPFTLMGAMTPVTLAAALAQQNAEALFGAVLAQVVRPGTPVLYGSFLSNVDMRSGAPAFGTPEHSKAAVASGQLARRYGLPYRCSPGTASVTADEQAVWESLMSMWGCVLGGANLMYHAAGWLEGGLCASYEKFVMDVELLQHLFEFLRPIEVSEATLGLDAIARVPTGGHFFGDPHTIERYQTAFYQPMLSDWRNWQVWVEDGERSARERASALWQRALAEYEAPAMDAGTSEALADYVARRKREIGDGEP